MIQRVLGALLACVLLTPLAAHAEGTERGFGLGLILGSPTALTAKYHMSTERALDFGLAYDFDDEITIYADYLVHFPKVMAGQPHQFLQELSPYIGIGGLFQNSDDPYVHDEDKNPNGNDGNKETNVAVRVPIGVEWLPSALPLGVFLEIVPAIFLVPKTEADIQGGLGLRYYFN